MPYIWRLQYLCEQPIILHCHQPPICQPLFIWDVFICSVYCLLYFPPNSDKLRIKRDNHVSAQPRADTRGAIHWVHGCDSTIRIFNVAGKPHTNRKVSSIIGLTCHCQAYSYLSKHGRDPWLIKALVRVLMCDTSILRCRSDIHLSCTIVSVKLSQLLSVSVSLPYVAQAYIKGNLYQWPTHCTTMLLPISGT
jgi:hypothetical protein